MNNRTRLRKKSIISNIHFAHIKVLLPTCTWRESFKLIPITTFSFFGWLVLHASLSFGLDCDTAAGKTASAFSQFAGVPANLPVNVFTSGNLSVIKITPSVTTTVQAPGLYGPGEISYAKDELYTISLLKNAVSCYVKQFSILQGGVQFDFGNVNNYDPSVALPTVVGAIAQVNGLSSTQAQNPTLKQFSDTQWLVSFGSLQSYMVNVINPWGLNAFGNSPAGIKIQSITYECHGAQDSICAGQQAVATPSPKTNDQRISLNGTIFTRDYSRPVGRQRKTAGSAN